MLVSFVRPSFINVLETHYFLALLLLSTDEYYFLCTNFKFYNDLDTIKFLNFRVQTIFVLQLAVKIVQNQSNLRPRFPLRIELLYF